MVYHLKTNCRCSNYFEYNWNEAVHKYFPDFYLIDSNTYIEVKGYKTERDEAKWKNFPEKLIILQENEINEIIKFNKENNIVDEYQVLNKVKDKNKEFVYTDTVLQSYKTNRK